jgi:hypothetical protein
MRFHKSQAEQLVRLAALGVDVRPSDAYNAPAPTPGHWLGWSWWRQRASQLFFGQRVTQLPQTAPTLAAGATSNVQAAPVSSTGARVYRFPPPAERRLP